jgi:hypothetical protein
VPSCANAAALEKIAVLVGGINPGEVMPMSVVCGSNQYHGFKLVGVNRMHARFFAAIAFNAEIGRDAILERLDPVMGTQTHRMRPHFPLDKAGKPVINASMQARCDNRGNENNRNDTMEGLLELISWPQGVDFVAALVRWVPLSDPNVSALYKSWTADEWNSPGLHARWTSASPLVAMVCDSLQVGDDFSIFQVRTQSN